MSGDMFESLTGLAAAYRDGSQRPSTVVQAHLERIAALDPKIGAFQTVYADEAMLAAEAADRMFAAGQSLGPFHGIPFGLKDICELAGRVTTGGSKAYSDRISTTTGTITERLIAAGGIVLGKTKTVECAFGGWGTNQHMGTPWNPWDMQTHRICGGSSSGTAASTAAGMAVCGVGTDTGGSVRLPAGFCGLVGLKVTEGRLPTDGILPLSQTLDTPGPLARSVKDALIMFLVMDGMPGAEILRAQQSPEGPFGALNRGVAGLRLGVLDPSERDHCAPEVLVAYDETLTILADLGAVLRTFKPPKPYAELTQTCGRIIATEAYFNHGALFEQTDLPLDADVRARMLTGRGITAVDYLQSLQDRITAKQQFLSAIDGYDALLTPTAPWLAQPLAGIDQNEAPGHFTRPGNYFGLCALSLPGALSPSGLPTSLQIMARPNAESMALRIGAAYEAARGAVPYPDLKAQ